MKGHARLPPTFVQLVSKNLRRTTQEVQVDYSEIYRVQSRTLLRSLFMLITFGGDFFIAAFCKSTFPFILTSRGKNLRVLMMPNGFCLCYKVRHPADNIDYFDVFL